MTDEPASPPPPPDDAGAEPLAAATTPDRPGDEVPVVGRPMTALAGFVLVLIAVLALREVADLVVPVVFGLFLALVTAPMIGAFQRRGLSRPIALTATILVVLGVVVIAVVVVVLSVVQLVGQAPEYEDEVVRAVDELRALLASFGVNVDGADLGESVDPSAIVGLVRPIASAVSSTGAALFVLAFTLIYALVGAGSLHDRAEAAFGRTHALLDGVERFGVDLRRYLVVRARLGLFAAVLSLILLWVLGVPFPLLWAFLMFAASFIPNVGFIIALVPPAILAFLEGGLVPAALVVVGYSLINVLQDHLLQPVVMGSELNLSPLVVMLSVIAWAWILGAAGALLAVPLTVALVQILELYPSTSGVASLMRNKAVTKGAAAG